MSFNLFGGNGVKAFNQLILQSGDWVAPCDCTVVMHVGGGGGSGGVVRFSNSTTDAIATGGAAGGYAIKRLELNQGDTISIVIGAGGTTTTGSASEKPGKDGGTTTATISALGLVVTATGGQGGLAHIGRLLSNPLTRPMGGVGSGGDYNTTGFRPFLSRNSGNTVYKGVHGGGGLNLLGLDDVSSTLLVSGSTNTLYMSTPGISAFGDYQTGNISATLDKHVGLPPQLPRATALGLQTVNPNFYSNLLNTPTFWFDISTYIGEGMGGGVHTESGEIRQATPFGGGASVITTRTLTGISPIDQSVFTSGGLGSGSGGIIAASSGFANVGNGGSGFVILEVYVNA